MMLARSRPNQAMHVVKAGDTMIEVAGGELASRSRVSLEGYPAILGKQEAQGDSWGFPLQGSGPDGNLSR